MSHRQEVSTQCRDGGIHFGQTSPDQIERQLLGNARHNGSHLRDQTEIAWGSQ